MSVLSKVYKSNNEYKIYVKRTKYRRGIDLITQKTNENQGTDIAGAVDLSVTLSMRRVGG